MHSRRYAVGSCSSAGELKLIRILSGCFRFWKRFKCLIQSQKGRCTVASDIRLFLLEEPIAEFARSVLTEEISAAGKALSLFKKFFRLYILILKVQFT